MCLYPTLIKNPKYKKTKKNGGVIPPIPDNRVTMVPIGCQNCMECRKQKARGWQVRLLEDVKEHTNGKFITLTFSNEEFVKIANKLDPILEGYDIDNAVATYAVRHFLENWRKEYGKSLRHWLVTELGHEGTEHIHLHGIIWTDEPVEAIAAKWKYGYTWKGKYIKKLPNGKTQYLNYVNEQTVNYITKYVYKIDKDHETYKPKILTSPGIGRNYTTSYNAKNNRFNGKATEETYRTRTGHKIAMPIYWRNKIYSEHQREQLWLNRLDKEERYVAGEKVSVKHGDQSQYDKLLLWHQKRNTELGYGDGNVSWEKKEYEKQLRTLKHEERGLKKQQRSLQHTYNTQSDGKKYSTTTIFKTNWYVTENGITLEMPDRPAGIQVNIGHRDTDRVSRRRP